MFLPHLLRRTEDTTTTAEHIEPPTVPAEQPNETTSEASENTSKRFSISRLNQETGNMEPIVFNVGEPVDVYFSADRFDRGTLKRVNSKQARVEFPPTEPGGRPCSMLFDFGRIYKPQPATEPNPAPTVSDVIPQPATEQGTEPETDSTSPDWWQHETEVQTFGQTLQESQVATLGGFSYSIEPSGTAWQFTRTQPDGTAETIVSGRYGFAFDSFARVVGYCVQDIRGRYVVKPDELANGCRIESRFHKRRAQIVYVVLHPEPLGAKFRNEETRAKRFGGWYAREYKPEFVAGGFMFLKHSDALQFAEGFKPSATLNRSETSKPKEPKPATARTGFDDANRNQAAKFRAMADSMQKTIDHQSRPMTQNPTAKRLREYAHRMHTAGNLENTRDALRALADVLEQSPSVPFYWIHELKSKNAVHELVTTRWDSSRDCSTNEFHQTTEVARQVQNILIQWRKENRGGISTEERQRRELERETLELSRQNIPGFYQTPRAIVARMISLADIEPDQTVLEPSAGAGAIADGIRERFADSVSVECWEPCGALRSILEKKRHNLRGFYFEECETVHERFDRVLMNPPFERNKDVEHVRRAFALLKPGGRLVAIVANGAGFGRLSDLVSEFGELDEPLPAGTFNTVESINTTNVSARLLVLQKPEND
jgi:predicted RNA methylase